jgi:hypothetical protein
VDPVDPDPQNWYRYKDIYFKKYIYPRIVWCSGCRNRPAEQQLTAEQLTAEQLTAEQLTAEQLT